jgi:hypothetical protein
LSTVSSSADGAGSDPRKDAPAPECPGRGQDPGSTTRASRGRATPRRFAEPEPTALPLTPVTGGDVVLVVVELAADWQQSGRRVAP